MSLEQANLRVPKDELEQARKAARAKGISLSEYLRRALALQLTYERVIDAQASYERGVEAGLQANSAARSAPRRPSKGRNANKV